jgi:hypothetical protein
MNNVEIKFVIPDHHIQSFLFKWVRKFLVDSSNRYCNVLISDIQNAYFQGDFFDELTLYIGQRPLKREYLLLSLEGPEEGKSLNSCHFHKETSKSICFQSILQDKDAFMENNMICSGSITGSHLGLLKLLEVYVEYMGYIGQIHTGCLSEPTLTDQFLLNLIIYQYFVVHPEELDLYMPSNFYSPTFTIGNLPNISFNFLDNVEVKITTNDGISRKPPYIHQVDRHPILENLVRQKLLALDNQRLSVLPISIVMVSYRSTIVLKQTLKSYIKSNLLDDVFEFLIYLQEISDDDTEIIEKLSTKFKVLGSSENLRLAYAIDILFNSASMPYILFLENDWEITVGQEEVLLELKKGIRALASGALDLYQLRSIQNPGFPLFLRLRYEFLEDELFKNNLDQLCGARFWVENYKDKWPQVNILI